MRGACLLSRKFPKMFASFPDNFDECQGRNDKSPFCYPLVLFDAKVFYYQKMSLDLRYS